MSNHTPSAGFALYWHQPASPEFDAAEFYDHGTVVTVRHPDGRSVTIDSDGERRYVYVGDDPRDDTELRTAAQFRAAYPHGELPEESDAVEIVYNAWFDLYAGDNGEHLDRVCYSLAEAIGEAEQVLLDNGEVKV